MRGFLVQLLARGIVERIGADGFALVVFLATNEQPVELSRSELGRRVGLSKRTVVELVRLATEAGFISTIPGTGRAPDKITVAGLTPTESKTTTTFSTGASSGDVVPIPAPLPITPPAVSPEIVTEPPAGLADESGASVDSVVELKAGRSSVAKRRARPDGCEVPEVLRTDEFLSKWAEWIKYRTERRAAMPATTRRMQLAKLAKHGVEAAIWAIDSSMCSGWQGLFPENFNKQGSTNDATSNARKGRVVRGRRVGPYE